MRGQIRVTHRLSKLGIFFFLAAAVASCGGGGGNGPQPVGGIDAGGFTIFMTAAPVTGFGSVIVGGVHYDTSQATIISDGAQVTEAELSVGQFVVVSGSINSNGNRTATRVEFDDNVEGPITSIDTFNGIIVVLGQTVIIDDGTIFDDNISPTSLAGLVVDDVIEVSGLVNADGNVIASRIEKKAAGGELEITGVVSNHNGGNQTFMINSLVVDYRQATLQDFAGGAPADGDLVEAKGNQLGGAGELLATFVERKNALPDDEAEVEIEGLITRFVSATDFDISGVPVTTNGQTVYEGGAAGDLGLNVKIEADGATNAEGVLLADKIDFKAANSIRMASTVDSVDAAAGTIVVLGITVEIGATTSMEDKFADLRPFTINDINVGDWVEVRGTETAPGSNVLAANLLERDDPDNESRIRGFAGNVNDPSFEILGLGIDTGPGTTFENELDAPITAGEFFGAADGRLVQADGTVNGGRLAASEVSLED